MSGPVCLVVLDGFGIGVGDSGDATALEAALRHLLSDGSELDRLARGARQARARLPDWDQTGSAFRQALRDLLEA